MSKLEYVLEIRVGLNSWKLKSSLYYIGFVHVQVWRLQGTLISSSIKARVFLSKSCRTNLVEFSNPDHIGTFGNLISSGIEAIISSMKSYLTRLA